MEWLGVIIFIAITVYDSVRKSNKAKEQKAQQQKSGKQPPVTHKDKGNTLAGSANPSTKKVQTSGSILSNLMDFIEEADKQLASEGKENPKKAKSAAKAKTVSPAKKHTGKGEKTVSQAGTSSQPTKQTLMEQRPDREQREEHTKVAASVKPLKNAYENDIVCEHRIELNPNIKYSGQKQKDMQQKAAIVKTDEASLIQGMIWSEILGKPKAYQNRAPRFHR